MLKSIKISLKDTIVYGLGNIAVKVVGLILIPLYTDPKFFAIDDFGVLGILEITALVLTAFLASALPQSLSRWYWDIEFKDKQKGIFFMCLSSQFIVSLLFSLLLIPLASNLSLVIFSTTDWTKVLQLVIIASCLQAINNIINTLMRLQSKSILYTVANVLKLITVLSLTLYLIIFRKMGLEGIYLAQVIGNALNIIVLLGYTFRNTSIFFDKSIFRSMSAYGFPLLLANIAAVFLNVTDRFALNSLDILKYVALYTLAFKISSVLKLVFVDSMKLAVGPMMFKRINSPDNKRFYSKVLLYSSFIMMFGIIGISLFSYEIIKVLTKSTEFWEAVFIVPLLSLQFFFVNMKEVTVYGLHIAKKTRIIGIIVVISTILSLALNILLIPLWSITGAAIATLISQFFYWLACHYYSQKVFFIPYEMKKLLLLLISGVLISFSGLFVNGMDLLPRMIIKIVCLVSFPFILYLFSFYEHAELQAIRGFYIKWSKIKNLKRNFASLKGIRDDE